MKNVRMGLIGCGSAGMHHLKVMLDTPGMDVRAVCDLNRKFATRAAQLAGASAYLDAETMMKEAGLDAVAIIATANAHYKLAMLAAKHGLHAICEKPLTVNAAQGRQVVDAFRKKKLILAVTFTFRFTPEGRMLKAFVEKGAIGRVLELRHVGWGGLAEKFKAGTEDRVKYDALYTPAIRGILFDCGVHTFDLFRWLAGRDYVRFLGMGACHEGYAYPDSGTVLAEMAGGIRCLYEHGPLPHYMNGAGGIPLGTFSIAGTKGSLVWKVCAARRRGKWMSELQVHTRAGSRSTWVPLYGGGHGKGRDTQHRDFVRSIRAGKLVGSFPAPADANAATDAAVRAVDAVLRHIAGARPGGHPRRRT